MKSIPLRNTIASCAIALALLALPAFAQTNWKDATGDWFNAGNWDNGVPASGVDANINNGGEAQIATMNGAAGSVTLGTNSSDVGTLDISGGNTLTVDNGVIAGYSGTGTLNITTGGKLSAYNLDVGLFPGGTGSATVDGAGSNISLVQLSVSSDGGDGTLNIKNGATVSSGPGSVGSDGTGVVNVDGLGSKWTITPQNGFLNIGNGISGSGTVNVTNGAVIQMTDPDNGVVVGNGSTGTLKVDGAGSQLTTAGNVVVGEFGTGFMNITDAGLVSGVNGYIGGAANASGAPGTGTATVDGVSSTWNNSGDLSLGFYTGSMGTLNITNGGTVTSNRSSIGENAGSSGTATVTGSGSTWTTTLSLIVGDSGTGMLNVMSGGVVTSDGVTIGSLNGSTGTVVVDGAGSKLTQGMFAAGATIADFGTGSLTVSNSGSVIYSALSVAGDAHGNGTVLIESGGTVQSLDGGGIANASSAVGTVTVTGTGSTLDCGSSIFDVGISGKGTLNITAGGTVVDGTSRIGGATGAIGTVTVDGAGSTWTNSDSLYVAGFAGGPGGQGSVHISNGGTVSTTNSVTIWDNGTVIDDAVLTAGTGVSVMSGGLLGGTGLVNGNVTNSGVVSPGDSPGTLTIAGNYVQNSGGLLKIEIAGLNSGVNSDLLQVNGAGGSSLDGTLQLIRLNNFKPLAGDRVNIINDPSGHTGTFFTVDLVNWGLIRPIPMYDEANDVYVVFELSSFSSLPGLTRNQRSVADELDEVANDTRATSLINFLGSEPLANLPHDYDLIAPEELASIYEIGFSQAVVQNMNLMHRMDDIRLGSTGYSGPVNEVPTGKDEAPISDKNVVSKNEVPAFVPCPENRWGVFALGSGDFVDVGNDDNNARGYSLTTGSMLVGVDYRMGDHVAIGIDGEYANDIAELADKGRVYVDGGKAGAFATVFGNGWFGSKIYVDLAGGGGWNSYDTRRVGLQGEDVRGSTDGAEWNGMLTYGSDWTCGHLTFGTWSSVQYTDVQFNHFTERGSLAPLEFPDQDEDSFRTTSGIRASYEMKFGNCGFVRPEVRAGWQHEYGDEAYPIDSRLASGAGDIFRVWGPTVGRDAALVDAGVTVQLSARFSTYVFYDGVLGRSNYQSNAVSGGFSVGF